MFKVLLNGDIEFLREPAVPLQMKNYTPDSKNPKLYRMNLPVCEHREFQTKKKECGAIVGIWFCKYYQTTFDPEKCDCMKKGHQA